jgi:hypothetical protein
MTNPFFKKTVDGVMSAFHAAIAEASRAANVQAKLQALVAA